MSTRLTIITPDGEHHHHINSAQVGQLDVRKLEDGSIQVVGVKSSDEVVRDGRVIRPAKHDEWVVDTYPPGSIVTNQA
jgi:hypothetical protein